MKPEEFRKLLNQSGLTREAAASLLGVGQRTIYDWLTSGINKKLMSEAVRRALREVNKGISTNEQLK